MAGKYEKYKPEFRDEVARLVIETTRSIPHVSGEYGRNEPTVGGWGNKSRAAPAADEPPLELSERARLRELERRNRDLEMENAFLKKASTSRGSSGERQIRVHRRGARRKRLRSFGCSHRSEERR